jgi:archaellum biogenesis ATPase FlaH
MIQVLAGEKGSGKTKKLFSIANELSSESKGHLIYISTNSEGIFELSPSIRLIDVSQFPISSFDSFQGFIYGMISQDYDIEVILIDNLTCILKDDAQSLSNFLDFAKKVSEGYNIKFILGIKGNAQESVENKVEYIAV